MTLKKALLAATMLALPLAAQAQPVSGLYVGAGAGANLIEETHDNGVKLKAKTGALGVGSIGYGFGNGLRAEVEGNFRQNENDKWTGPGNTGLRGHNGYVESYGAMANVLYDFNLGLPVTPYVGAGAGYGWQRYRGVLASAGTSTYKLNDIEGNFAYQGILGGAYDLGAGLALTLEYRFMGMLPSTYGISHTGPTIVGAPDHIKPENFNHSFLLGIRYAFNAPVAAVAPVVAAPPAVARTYLVFFDWDKANLTDRAKQIIAEAAEASRKTGTTKIDVAGHADRSGTPAYNQKLSQRRADAVAAELVKKGVAKTDIVVTAFGESRPLVPTADGVREPQNRRVEIVLK